MADQEMIPLAYLNIEGAGEYESLLSIQINTGANTHGMMECRLLLTCDQVQVTENDHTGQTITAKGPEGRVLFTGICTGSRTLKQSSYAELLLTVTGFTIEADRKAASRTFQDPSKTLSAVCSQVLKAYGATVTVGKDLVISQILTQDKETDWAFLVRIANQYGMDVYSDAVSCRMHIQIGVEGAARTELGDNSIPLEESKDLGELRLLAGNEGGLYGTCQFVQGKIRTWQPSVMAGNQADGRIIRSSSLRSEKGVLVTDVITESAKNSRASYHSAAAAALDTRVLSGKVIEVQGTRVKVKFDVDAVQDAAAAVSIGYENTLSHSFYCMPDVGDRVYAYVDNQGGAVVLGSRRSGLSDPFFANPEEKAVTSLDNLIRFESSALELMANRESGTADENTKVSLRLDDLDGISIHAAGSVLLRSLKDITIAATAEQDLDIPAKIASHKQTYETMSSAGYARYQADCGTEQGYDSAAGRWFSDAWKDVSGSFVNLGKSMVLYDFWHKSTVEAQNDSETFRTGTISLYGQGIRMSAGGASIRLGYDGNQQIYISADLLSWLGTEPQKGYELVSDAVKSTWDTALDFITVGLDIAATVCMFFGPVGMAFGVGLLGVSAGISLTRGDYAGALLSLIPVAGAVGKGAKLLEEAPKAAKIFSIATTTVSTWVRASAALNQARGLKTGYQSWEDMDTADQCLLLLQTVDAVLGVAQGVYDVKTRNARIAQETARLAAEEPVRVPEVEASTTRTTRETADPVDVVTGALTVTYTDLIIPDIKGDFPLVRTYRSIHENRGGMLGSRWRYNIESSLIRNEEEITVCLYDMHKERFWYADGCWQNTVAGRENYVLKETGDGYEVRELEIGRTYTFDREGRVLLLADRNQNRTRYRYEAGLLESVTFASGQEIRFSYEGGRIAALGDGMGRQCRFSYEGELLTEMTGPNGGQVSYAYTREGYLAKITNENGKWYVKNQYDRKGRVIRQETADGGEYIFFYQESEKQNTVTAAAAEPGQEHSETYCYNRSGLVERILLADGSEKRYRYDACEHITYECDELGRETFREYSREGRLLRETLPTGLTTDYQYDEAGNLTEQSDQLGRRTKYRCDAHGNRTAAEYLLEEGHWAKNRMTYDAHGRMTGFTDAEGGTRSWAYDRPYAHATRYTGPEGETLACELDSYGRNMAVRSACGEIEYTYNLLNFVTAVTDEEGSTERHVYDLAGNRTAYIRPGMDGNGEGPGTRYDYDCMDRLVRTTDPCGNVRAVNADCDGHITKEISPDAYDKNTGDGEGIRYLYDLRGNRTAAVCPTGGTERYLYDACGNLTKIIRPEEYARAGEDGAGFTYAYDSGNRLIRVTDPEGNVRKRYCYDAAGRLLRESGAEDAGTRYAYNLVGWLTEKREPVESDREGNTVYRLTAYEYDANGNQTKEKRYLEGQTETSAGGRILTIQKEYDRSGRLVRMSDSTGSSAVYTYNERGQRLTEKRKISGETYWLRRFTYKKNGLPESMAQSVDYAATGKRFAVTFFAYDRSGNLTRITTPSGNEIRREYDPADRLIRETHIEKGGGIHNTVTFCYDPAGNLVKMTDGSGRTQRRTYDRMDRLVLATSADGGMTAFRYDQNGNLTKRIPPESYALKGAEGYGETYRYDTQDRQTAVLDAYGKLIRSSRFNSRGELEEILDGTGGGVSFTYDLAGRRTSARTAGGATAAYGYDVQGNLCSVTDGEGNRTKYDLDPWGRITAVCQADGSIEQYAYDHMGNIVNAADGEGHATSYVYNAMNRLSARTDAAGRTETWQYDLEGNPCSHTDRNGVTVQYAYNMYGSRTRRYERAGGYQENWAYLPDGRLSCADGGGRRYIYTYDEAGRLKTKESGSRTLLSYAYDLNGNRSAMTDFTGKRVEYRYDRNGRLKEVLDGNEVLAEYGYHPDGTIRALRLGTDIHTEYRYDTDRNLTGLRTWLGEGGNGWKRKEEEPGKGDAGTGGKTGCEVQGETGLWFGTGVLTDNTYTYDRNGTMRTKQTLEGLTEYCYNEVSALVKVQYPERTDELFYDKAGNRSRKVSDGVETRYTYDDCNRLLEVSGAEQEILSQYRYDAQGNLIQDERARYTVDAINRVVQAETFDGNIQINRYDAEGLRAEMEENGRISKFVFDGKNVVAEETDEGVIRYIRGDRILASDSEHARTYYHYVGDELGSVIHVIQGEEKGYFDKEESESQERIQSEDRILNRYAYDAFGNRTVCEEKIANRFGYAGEQYDGITQQYYLRARFYNPIIGRFTQEDTYYGDGLNLYEYGRNNPVRYIDPSGHEVRAAAEKNYVNRAVDAMNGAVDQGVNGMLERVYGEKGGLDSMSDPYAGVRNASEYLKSQGVPREYRKPILQSFDVGTIKMQTASDSTYGLRFYGGNADVEGRYLFETFTPLINRQNLALPYEWNSMAGIQQFQVRKGTTIITGNAAAQSSFGSQYIGGAKQWYINNLEDLIKCQ